jgi:hypothetical protein
MLIFVGLECLYLARAQHNGLEAPQVDYGHRQDGQADAQQRQAHQCPNKSVD